MLSKTVAFVCLYCTTVASVASVACVATAGSTAASTDDVANFTLPEFNNNGNSAVSLWATYYYLPQMNAVSTGHVLRAMDGSEFPVKLEHRNYCIAAMEGSVRIRSNGTNKVYNYAGKSSDGGPNCGDVFSKYPAAGVVRWREAYGSFGDGTDRGENQTPWILIPYRSIAVDPSVIPYGTAIYVPAARGVRITLPDGRSVLHDGYFIGSDRGGLIKQNHIDVFIGISDSNPFKFVQSEPSSTFNAYLLKDSSITEALQNASILK